MQLWSYLMSLSLFFTWTKVCRVSLSRTWCLSPVGIVSMATAAMAACLHVISVVRTEQEAVVRLHSSLRAAHSDGSQWRRNVHKMPVVPNYWMRLCILVAEEQKVTGLRHSWGCVLEKIAIEQKWVPGCEVAKGEVDLHFTHAMPKTSWIIYGSLPFIATRPWDSLLNDLAVKFFS